MANQSYISLTAHWIDDDFLLRSANLLCEHFPGNHTADAVNKKVGIEDFFKIVELLNDYYRWRICLLR